MKRFRVTVESRQSGTLDVTASDLAEAQDKAMRLVAKFGMETATQGCCDDPDEFIINAQELAA